MYYSGLFEYPRSPFEIQHGMYTTGADVVMYPIVYVCPRGTFACCIVYTCCIQLAPMSRDTLATREQFKMRWIIHRKEQPPSLRVSGCNKTFWSSSSPPMHCIPVYRSRINKCTILCNSGFIANLRAWLSYVADNAPYIGSMHYI